MEGQTEYHPQGIILPPEAKFNPRDEMGLWMCLANDSISYFILYLFVLINSKSGN
jgi:hypothetical protein